MLAVATPRPRWLLACVLLLCVAPLSLTACDDDDPATGTDLVGDVDGDTAGGDTAGPDTSTPAAPVCGNGQVEAGEQCDDGNADDTDRCTSSCETARCGDGVVQGDEQCDDGNAIATDTCLPGCIEASCGDGITGPGEGCDDANTDDDDACTNTCAPSTCGDGIVQMPEQCDDANTDETDGCLSTCVVSSCGDGVVSAGEQCDDGNADDTDMCTSLCERPRCGDGFVQGTEQCDDGNAIATDGCLPTCRRALCGDGVPGPGEACDDGNTNNNDTCKNDCSLASCGDGIVQAPEQCDDGNTSNFDSCLNSCLAPRCGDGIVQVPEECDEGGPSPACTPRCELSSCGDGRVNPLADEQCDDGNSSNLDTCTNACAIARCGDGFVQGTEQCDDGNLVLTDACLPTCRTARCGDGVTGPGEGCDDGNQIGTDRCSNGCVPAGCGDGVVNATEQCDDGNANNNDACLDTCVAARCGDGVVGPGEQCDTMGPSSTCTATCTTSLCGDGIVNPAAGEQCDDGNTSDTDLCASTCRVPTCTDGAANGAETDIDCGGPCGGCAAGHDCDVDADCAGAAQCLSGVCRADTCTNGVRDAEASGETDVDCGGTCAACATGLACLADSDCASSLCEAGQCRPASCDNGTQDAGEVAVDCGGPCAACGTGTPCGSDAECLTGMCEAMGCAAPAASCATLAAGNPSLPSGPYEIDTDGAGANPAVIAWCDMDSDGGVGHTLVRLTDATLQNTQSAYRNLCASIGMELVVPRTREHAMAILAYNGAPPNLVGVYPQTDQASGLDDFEGACDGTRGCTFWVSDATLTSYAGQLEPNAENFTSQALVLAPEPPASRTAPFGTWIADGSSVPVPGYVLCSTNDTGSPAVLPTCLDYLQADRVWTVGPDGIDGSYPIDAMGTTAVCDMTSGGWTRVAHTTFDTGSATPWSPSTVDTTDCGPALGGGGLLGPLGMGATATASYDLAAWVHTEARVTLDVVVLDDWDGEQGRVDVGGNVAWFGNFDAVDATSPVCGAASDDLGAVAVEWHGPHTANALSLSVGSTLDEAMSDESFGVDEVEVWVR